MTGLYVIYASMTWLTFCVGVCALRSDDRGERRLGARAALTAPGWPIWVGVVAWWGVRSLLREAGWLR